MAKKLFVGNLSYTITDRDLQAMFAAHGAVTSATLVTDRDSGRSKGFGFVEMGNDKEAQAAIAALHGKDFDGRALIVNEARPREQRSDNFGGSGGRGGRGGNSGGGFGGGGRGGFGGRRPY